MNNTHQPFIITRDGSSQSALVVGDTIKCESGCDYARIKEIANGWPQLEMMDGNIPAIGQVIPIHCKCGSVAIKWEDDLRAGK